jgi:methionyl aminopeptidase
MPIVLKTRREIDLMRTAGKLAHDILLKMSEHVRPGVSTQELDDLAEEDLARFNAVGLSKN